MGLDATAVKRDSMRIVHDLAATPPGFKHTEAGLVPEEWTPKAIVDFAPLQRGYDLPSTQLRPGPVPVVYSNGVLQTHERAMAKGPGVVTGRSGTIGKVHFVEDDYWPHNTALWVTSFLGNDPRFVYYLYSYIDFARFLSGSGVPTLNRSDVHNFVIACPPLPEQRAIAEALSDVDGLLATQDALIAKKRDIKLAAMQQLLTGRTRLPGFEGNWETRPLGEIAELVMGQSPRSEFYNTTGQGIPLIQGNADIAHRQTVRRTFTTHITKQGLLGDILMSVRAPVGEIARATFDICLGRGVCAIRYPNSYLYHYLVFLEPSWAGRSRGSTFDSVNSSDVRGMEIAVPSLEEQLAIATLLSDMDTEITALEAQRDKTRMVKQGMMQQLLTGRVRLVQTEATA